jgi:hypothetical protein
MKSKVILAALALCFVCGLRGAAQEKQSSAARAPRPRLVIASLEHSFGTVKPGAPLKYTFEVKNEGQADLEIESVSPSCGCTTSDYDRVISPGKSGSITLAIEKTEKYKGEVVKTATVTTNDPDRPTFTLTLRASFPSE